MNDLIIQPALLDPPPLPVPTTTFYVVEGTKEQLADVQSMEDQGLAPDYHTFPLVNGRTITTKPTDLKVVLSTTNLEEALEALHG